ncbi:hypothetical protein [uncultured Draconibacterium sp.]|uniref:hypothetical protein n=1 Tax=uncultured Draconibacterium sp. TaxID=1573823 RepID=UPI0029C6138A|nr:hypothetical protein [uncultured Draconibacterium sp.]
MKAWILYNIIVGFAVYWMSNLILWFPWSINPVLGMTLMLTVSPIIWLISTFSCIRTFPKKNILIGAVYNSLIFLVIAVVMDYVFFGLIRNAMEQLYHPTTFYGYGFVASIPFIAAFGLRKKIEERKGDVRQSDFVKAGTTGLVCFGSLTLIIILGIEI